MKDIATNITKAILSALIAITLGYMIGMAMGSGTQDVKHLEMNK